VATNAVFRSRWVGRSVRRYKCSIRTDPARAAVTSMLGGFEGADEMPPLRPNTPAAAPAPAAAAAAADADAEASAAAAAAPAAAAAAAADRAALVTFLPGPAQHSTAQLPQPQHKNEAKPRPAPLLPCSRLPA
jgi:hypothetical protein